MASLHVTERLFSSAVCEVLQAPTEGIPARQGLARGTCPPHTPRAGGAGLVLCLITFEEDKRTVISDGAACSVLLKGVLEA